MHNRARVYISAFLYYTGIVKLFRWWVQLSGRRLIILNYHQAIGGDLRSHWLYLNHHYHILPLETALEELYMPYKKGAQRKDRRALLAVTFDDGYYDNYTHAFPLACELKIPITIFLIPGHMESGNSFWWATRLIRLAQVDHVTLEGRTYHLEQQEERKALAQTIDASFSHAPSPTMQKDLLASLSKLLAVPSPIVFKEKPTPLLTWAQAREMQESGWIAFGAHTMYHPDLGSLTDAAQVEREVGECRTVLEQQLGHPITIFAYPFGRVGDHGRRAVKEAGYNWAVTIISGNNTHRSDPYLLRRKGMDVNKHWLVVAAETAGIWEILSRLKINARLLIRSLRMNLKRENP